MGHYHFTSWKSCQEIYLVPCLVCISGLAASRAKKPSQHGSAKNCSAPVGPGGCPQKEVNPQDSHANMANFTALKRVYTPLHKPVSGRMDGLFFVFKQLKHCSLVQVFLRETLVHCLCVEQ